MKQGGDKKNTKTDMFFFFLTDLKNVRYKENNINVYNLETCF